jgi:hypothetical protein
LYLFKSTVQFFAVKAAHYDPFAIAHQAIGLNDKFWPGQPDYSLFETVRLQIGIGFCLQDGFYGTQINSDLPASNASVAFPVVDSQKVLTDCDNHTKYWSIDKRVFR